MNEINKDENVFSNRKTSDSMNIIERGPKKVSFSDEIPSDEDQSNSIASEDNNNSDLDESLNLPLKHSIKQTSNYLNEMHNIENLSLESKDSMYEINLQEDIKNSSKSDENTINDRNTIYKIPAKKTKFNDCNYSIMELEAKREKLRQQLLSECFAYFGDGKHTREGFRKIFTDQDFLQNFFRLFDLDGEGFLMQDKWIEQIKGRLTDQSHLDFAEQLESVTYVLCGESRISYGHFCQIWNARGILDKLYRIIDIEACNQVATNRIMDFVTDLTDTRPRMGFDKTSLKRLELLFRRTVGSDNEICREDFKKIVTSKNPFFTERVFQIFDKDNSGAISLQEFIDAIHQFAGQSVENKVKFLFKVYDIDGDGLIQYRELQHVMRACMEENGMQFSEDQIEDLIMAIIEDADPQNKGAITYEALKGQLERHGGLLENLSISIDRWLVPLPEENTHKKRYPLPHQFTRAYIKNNYAFISFLLIYFGINAGLFISRSIQYKESNGFVILARACGQCLNFNCAWVLVMMLRHSITFLRTRGFSSILPLDHHVYLHKLTGIIISILSLVHTVMHLFNFSLIVVNDPIINAKNYTLSEWILTEKPGLFGLVPGCANPTGITLCFILMIMFICSQPFVRRTGSFEVFYWTHLLYIPFWMLVFFHGPNFWKWFIIPGFIYTIERIICFTWMKSKRGKTYISSGLLLPSRVTHLVIKRPVHFCFRPGDYAFINIPAIAKYEWHPFTISSAPEQEDYIWLHIRGVGEWTNSLYNYFEKEQERLHGGEVPAHINSISNEFNSNLKSTNNAQEIFETTTTNRKEINENSMGSNNSRDINPEFKRQTSVNRTIRRIKDSLQRTFSKKENPQVHKGIINDAYITNEKTPRLKIRRKFSPDIRLETVTHSKQPLEKSYSLPNMQNKNNKTAEQRKLQLISRSESERSFDEIKLRRAHLHSLRLAYLSPQNKSLAQSFRYVRNKPTIIAFKTPSLENCEQRTSSQSMIMSREDFNQKDAEEGKISNRVFQQESMNYPVGKPLEIYINGPYGAPSSHIFRAQHAVLIATGIGVTPFASILQSIMHRYWKARHSCPRCRFEWASDIPKTVMNLRKVDFFWINRDQKSFEWFIHLLSQLEIEQAELGGAMERFLDMHMYITSALQKTDMKALGLQLALDLLHQKEKRDLITGLKTRTNAGRPNWDKVFKQIIDQKKGKVTIFYCGPPQLGKVLRYKCDQFGFVFKKENF